MPRIDGVRDADAGPIQKLVFRGGRVDGKTPEPLRIMAHSGHVMWASGLYHVVSESARRVPKNLKALASLKAASMIGCVF